MNNTIPGQNLIQDIKIQKYFFPYVHICRDFLVPEIDIENLENKCATKNVSVIFGGTKGAAVRFECSNGKSYVIKLFYNFPDDRKQNEEAVPIYDKSIYNEFKNINLFDSRYIMSGHKYLFFEQDKEFGGYVFYIYDDRVTLYKDKDVRLASLIEVHKRLRAHYTDEGYQKGLDVIIEADPKTIKDEQIESNKKTKAIRIPIANLNETKYKIDSEIPYFGGIILEDVQYRFQELEKVKNPFVLLELFRQYVVGLKEITDKGYVHSDIKADNLMYNITNGNYEAKIIDIDVVDMKKKTGIFQRREELLQDSNRKTEHNTAQELLNKERNDEDNKHLDKITRSYDLYSLCETFLGITHLTIKQKDDTIYTITSTPYNLLGTIQAIPEFFELLKEGTNTNFEERIDIDQALSKVCAIQKKYAEKDERVKWFVSGANIDERGEPFFGGAARRQRLLNTRLSTPKRRWGGRRTQKKKK